MVVSYKLRFTIFKRDDFTCRYCGRRAPEVRLECDHALPKSRGGSDHPVNLVTACYACNRGKRAGLLPEQVEDQYERCLIESDPEREVW